MQHIQGISSQQLQISSLEDTITLDNPVRFIEAFVENISLEALGLRLEFLKVKVVLASNQKYFLNFIFMAISTGLEARES